MERRLGISGIEEQNNPADVAINEQQGSVPLAFIDAMRARAVVEIGSNPSTHPLNRGGWKAPESTSGIGEGTDPTG